MNLNTEALNLPKPKHILADNLLKKSAVTWFIIAIIGQWLFAYYVLVFYGSSTVRGDLDDWNEVLPHGYVPGDPIGNLVVGIHLLMAAIIMLGGPLQFIPQIRKYAKTFHRWNGRVYLINGMIAGISGFIMVWTRGAAGGFANHIAISINAFLIILFAIIAWRFALLKQFKVHGQWAFRLLLVMSGVWFFRILLMFWLLVNGRPVGFDPETFRGPFLIFLGFAQYLLPLAIYELYLFVQRNANQAGKLAMGIFILLCTVITGIGVFAATMGMWLPRL